MGATLGDAAALGDESALSETPDPRHVLYRKYAAGAFRRAQRLLGNAADAAEVVHDVFIALFEQPQQHRGGSMNAYVYSAVTHACLNRIRDRRNRTRLATERTDAEAFDPGTSVEAALLARDALAEMPDQLAQIAIYYYLDELTHREIAELLGCSHRHVGNMLQRLTRWAEQREPRAWRR